MNECSVCVHRAVIGSMAELGASVEEIAEHIGADVATVETHLSQCISALASDEPDTLDTSDERLRLWRDRADQLYLASGTAGDQRNQVAALREAVKVELAHRTRLAEKVEKAKAAVDPANIQFTVQQIDNLIRAHAEHPFDLENGVTARALELVKDHRFCSLVQAIWCRRELLPILENCVQESMNVETAV